MIIKKASIKDIDNLAKILSTCFIQDYSETKNSLKTDPRRNISDFIISYEGKTPTGCLAYIPFETYIRNKKMKFYGVGGVAVLPEYRRKGIAEELCAYSLIEMYKNNYPASILYPFQHRFYRKFGWESVGYVNKFEISPNNIINSNNREFVRSFKEFDKKEIKRIYSLNMEKGNCHIFRNDKFWLKKVFPNWKNCVVYDNNGLYGYMVFELEKDKIHTNLIIKEFICMDYLSYSSLLSFLSSMEEQVYKIDYLTSIDNPLQLFLKEPVTTDQERLFFEYKTFSRVGSGFMFRVTNLSESLKFINYEKLDDFALTFNIKDKYIKQNNKPLTIIKKRNKLLFSDQIFPDKLIEMDINIFSLLFSGSITLTKLLEMGKAKCNPNIAEICDILFKAPAPFIYQADIF